MAIKDVASGRSDLYRLDPKIIQIKEGWNSREATDPQNSNHIAELAASIREVGVKKPLVCYMENDIVYVTDGHCRLQAVMLWRTSMLRAKGNAFTTTEASQLRGTVWKK